LSVAALLALIAATIGLWPTERQPKAPPQSGTPTLSAPDPLSASPLQTGPFGAQDLPTLFTNPFDTSEVFEFPPGTTEDAARESVAEMLLQRARERRAQVSSVKHVHRHPSGPLQTPALMSQSFFKSAT
jgi:hypothetical protein